MIKTLKKNNKGITLIALVITIVILIILAGVSINTTLGEEGIITKAKEAKENIELAQVEEKTKLNELYIYMTSNLGGLEDTSGGEVSSEQIAELQNEFNLFKVRIAEAITNKGIETAETDTVEQMVSNIGNITTGIDTSNATATSDKI